MTDENQNPTLDVYGTRRRLVQHITAQATAAQNRASDPAASVWVGASAGTGKTRVLKDRLLRLLLSGARAQGVLCLTFTKAAAAEMMTRLGDSLTAWTTAPDDALRDSLRDLLGQEPEAAQMHTARTLFAQVLDSPGGIKVQTIHAFCQSVLARFPLEAGIAPNFRVLEEAEAQQLLQQATGRVLSGTSQLAPDLLQDCLDKITPLAEDTTFQELLQKLLSQRGRLSRLPAQPEELKKNIFATLDLIPDLCETTLLHQFCSLDGATLDKLDIAIPALAAGKKTDRQRAKILRDWRAAPSPERRSVLYARYCQAFLTKDGTRRKSLATQGVPDVNAILNSLANSLMTFEKQRKDQHNILSGLSHPPEEKNIFTTLDLTPDPSEMALLHQFCSVDEMTLGKLDIVIPVLATGSKADRERATILRHWRAAPSPERRFALYKRYCQAFLTNEGTPHETLATKDVPNLNRVLDDLAHDLMQFEEQRKGRRIAEATFALLTVGRAILDDYRVAKVKQGGLDYDDLILKTRDLLSKSGAAAWVMYKLDGGLDHVLVDEAQDTNPEQWAVIRLLCEEFFAGAGVKDGDDVRTVFVVGDAKQSIYSFQRADPDVFEQMQQDFQARVEGAGQCWKKVDLSVSFRSTAAVLSAVDDIFTANPEGVLFSEDKIHHEPQRVGQAGQVEIWPLVQHYERDKTALPLEQGEDLSAPVRLARILAERIWHWTRDPAGCDDPDCQLPSQGRRMEPGDILVLVRKRTGSFITALIRELKNRGVPVAGVDRMVLTQQIAVMDLLSLGRFLLMPDDDLSLAELLKSPLIGWGDDLLFDLAHDRPQSLWARLRDWAQRPPQRDDISEAYGFLSKLLNRVDQIPPFEFYSWVLGPLGGRRKILARLGPEAADPLEEFLTLALDYERTETPSLQGFLHWLEARDDVEIKRELEQAGGNVRIMTVHGAKGLEAPVVLIPDAADTPVSRGGALFWDEDKDKIPLWATGNLQTDKIRALKEDRKKKDLDEYRRLLYVALTRAQDRLVICGCKKTEKISESSWYHLCCSALEKSRRKVVFDCPEWAGLLRQQPQAIAPQGSGRSAVAVTEPVTPPPWVTCPPPDDPAPPRPLVPSRLVHGPVVRSPLLRGQDHGVFQRGNLIHRLLQDLPALPPSRWEEVALAFLAPHCDSPTAQALFQEVRAVLCHPDFAPLFGPDSRAEVPVTGLVHHAGEAVDVVSGRVDRLLVAPARVVVVDFKTNHSPPERPEDTPVSYRRQLALYQKILTDIYPDRPVECCLLWTEGPQMMPIPDALLRPVVSD